MAHETALEQGLKNIAVFAGGLKHNYPTENKTLTSEILKNGVLISEFPIGAKLLAQNFPIFKFVISGLQMGILVTEVSKKKKKKITTGFVVFKTLKCLPCRDLLVTLSVLIITV